MRRSPARASIIAGSPLSQVATPSTPLRRGQRADQAAEDDRGVVAIRQAVHHPGRPLRPAVARVGDHPGERGDAEPLAAPRPPPAPAGRPPSGPCDSPARSACRRARGGRPGCSGSGYGSRSTSAGVPAHAGVLAQAEEVARGPVAEHLVGQRQRRRPGRRPWSGPSKQAGSLSPSKSVSADASAARGVGMGVVSFWSMGTVRGGSTVRRTAGRLPLDQIRNRPFPQPARAGGSVLV